MLDVENGLSANGTNVRQYYSNDADAQKWIIKETSDGYYNIISKASETYLDVAGGIATSGTNVRIYSENGTNAQKFYFKEVPIITDGNYQIVITSNENKVLDIDDSNIENDGANLQIWDDTNSIQQKFTFEYLDDGYYTIKSKKSLKVLEVQEGSTNVAQATLKNTDNQKWKIELSDEGYFRIKSKSTELYLNVHRNGTTNGTNVEVAEKTSSSAQIFKLIKINIIRGIDVSSHQNIIDWISVSKSDVDFAMIRAAYRGYRTGKIVTDFTFSQNLMEAYANGIDVGVYFFSQAISIEEAEEEANYVVNLLRQYKRYIKYPVAIDTERTEPGDGRGDLISKELRTQICIKFCEVIKAAGYTPMIYANKDWYMNDLEFSKLSNYDIWLAHYTNQTDFKYGYDMWQYTSSGSVNGIRGNVDLDYCYKKY